VGNWPQAYTGPQLSAGAFSASFISPLHITIDSSSFTSSQVYAAGIRPLSSAGGAISIVSTHPNSSLSFLNSKATDNSASAGTQPLESSTIGVCQGGAVHLFTAGDFLVSGSSFYRNQCYGPSGGLFGILVSGGAIDFNAVAQDSKSNSTISIEIRNSEFVANSLTTDAAYLGNAEMASGGAVSLQLRHLLEIGRVIIADCLFDGNIIDVMAGDAFGGAVTIDNIGTTNQPMSTAPSGIQITNCIFSGNNMAARPKKDTSTSYQSPANLNGGALSLRLRLSSASSVFVSNCSFHGNFILPKQSSHFYGEFLLSASAAAMHVGVDRLNLPDLPQPAVAISHCMFVNNNCTGTYVRGGAISIHDDGAVEIRSTVFEANRVSCLVGSGTSPCQGGAIYVKRGLLVLESTKLNSNGISSEFTCAALMGGALYAESSNVTAKLTEFNYNFASSTLFSGALDSFQHSYSYGVQRELALAALL
jgi:hypothetical protein